MFYLSLDVMVEVQFGPSIYVVGWKLANLLRFDRINSLWPILF